MMNVLKHPNRVMAEVQLVSSHFGPVDFNNTIVVVERFNLPPGFNKASSKLLISLPGNYPEGPPSGMYLEERLKKNGFQPGHYFESKLCKKTILETGYAWYSIHFKAWSSNARSIIRGDNLLTAINALYDALKFDN